MSSIANASIRLLTKCYFACSRYVSLQRQSSAKQGVKSSSQKVKSGSDSVKTWTFSINLNELPNTPGSVVAIGAKASIASGAGRFLTNSGICVVHFQNPEMRKNEQVLCNYLFTFKATSPLANCQDFDLRSTLVSWSSIPHTSYPYLEVKASRISAKDRFIHDWAVWCRIGWPLSPRQMRKLWPSLRLVQPSVLK